MEMRSRKQRADVNEYPSSLSARCSINSVSSICRLFSNKACCPGKAREKSQTCLSHRSQSAARGARRALRMRHSRHDDNKWLGASLALQNGNGTSISSRFLCKVSLRSCPKAFSISSSCRSYLGKQYQRAALPLGRTGITTHYVTKSLNKYLSCIRTYCSRIRLIKRLISWDCRFSIF